MTSRETEPLAPNVILPPSARRGHAALLALIVIFTPAQAVEPGEMLKDPALEARARHISQELRCLVCQNQSIDDSNASWPATWCCARAPRRRRQRRRGAGLRRGPLRRVRAAAPAVVAAHGAALVRPLLLLAGAALLLIRRTRAARAASATAPQSAPLSPAEQQRLEALLGRGKDEAGGCVTAAAPPDASPLPFSAQFTAANILKCRPRRNRGGSVLVRRTGLLARFLGRRHAATEALQDRQRRQPRDLQPFGLLIGLDGRAQVGVVVAVDLAVEQLAPLSKVCSSRTWLGSTALQPAGRRRACRRRRRWPPPCWPPGSPSSASSPCLPASAPSTARRCRR